MSDTGNNTLDVVVVGGGQSGLVAGYELTKQGRSFAILDANAHVGDAWRNRWDSLRLFTPALFSGLPGMRFPGPQHLAPTKDQMADYLEAYAEAFALPVRGDVHVERIKRDNGVFVIDAGKSRYTARSVVVATGGHHHPHTPAFADRLDPSIAQIHSARYRNPAQLRDGSVLLVGAGNSGADIAMETVRTRATWLAGPNVGHVPFRIDARAGRKLVHVVRFVGQHILTQRSPIGRKVLRKLAGQGNPLVRVKPKDLTAAGVVRVGRVEGVRDGRPALDDGSVLDVANVIWCTGYRPDWSWIDARIFAPDGTLAHRRGVTDEAGLFFVGLPFQFAATSDVLTGVGRDVRYVTKRLAAYLSERSLS